MDSNTPVGPTTLGKLERASIKRIIKDLVGKSPELFEDALIEGIRAQPPRSFPYLALAAAYLDGKPIDAEPALERIADLSALSREQLGERAERLVHLLKPKPEQGLAVIDATIIPEEKDFDTLSPAELQEQIRLAQIEVDRANEELRRLKR